MRRSISTAAALVALATAGCGAPAALPFEPAPSAATMPDFALGDENPDSASYGLEVGPRQFRGEVSAWYFGHST